MHAPLRTIRRRPLLRTVLAVFALVVVACATPPKKPSGGIPKGDYSYLIDRMTFDITAAMKDQGAVSFAIAVVDKDAVIWEQAFGFADKERATVADVTSIYRLGSVSKVVTAIGVMQLVDAGKIDLDAPITTYIPDFALGAPPASLVGDGTWSTEHITTRRILTHLSGIPGDIFHRMISKKPHAYGDYVALLKEEHAAAPAGVINAYSNVAMTLLGVLIEKTSGMPFEKYMRERVLRPSGMKLADFDYTDQMKPLNTFAHKKGQVVDDYPIGQKPAGSLYASVRDMGAFMQMVLKSGQGPKTKVLDEKRLKEMWQRQNGDVPLDFDLEMGLAWFLAREHAPSSGLMVEHGGATVYHRSAMKLLPDHGLGVVVVTNSAEGQTDKLAMDALFLALETKTGILRPSPPAASPTESTFTAAELDALAGAYDTQLGFLRLTRDDDELVTQVVGEKFVLRPTKAKTFQIAVKLFGFFPFQPESLERVELSFEEVAGKRVIVAKQDGKRAFFGTREEPPPLDDVWRARLGAYTIANGADDILLFDAFELKDDQGALVITMKPTDEKVRIAYALAPVDGTRATIVGLGRNRGQSIYVVEQDGREALRWSGYVLAREDTSTKK
jgi:CubicO group peptidase (beta-lactamase class C family)